MQWCLKTFFSKNDCICYLESAAQNIGMNHFLQQLCLHPSSALPINAIHILIYINTKYIFLQAHHTHTLYWRAFSALTLLVGWQEGHPACLKKWGNGGGGHWLVQMEWHPAGWSVCLPLLIFPCTIKSRSSLLAPAHPGGPGKRAIKCLCVCVCVCMHAWRAY